MPKVGGSMAQVSTTFIPVPPDTYVTKLEDIKFEQKDGRNTFIISNKVVSGEDTGADNAGRVITDRISMHKKDGTPNEIGSVQLKRYIEAVKPEAKDWDEAQWDEFDTDDIKGAMVQMVVVIEPDKNDPEIKYNRVKRVTSVE